MRLILFHLGDFQIYTTSFFLSLAFLFATFVIWREARRRRFEEEKILDLVVFMVLGGIILGRVAYFLFNPNLFSDLGWLILFWKVPGISFTGTLLGAVIVAFWMIRKNHWPVSIIFDNLMLGSILGLALYNLGVFLSGGGFGVITHSFLGTNFLGIPDKRHPVALYETIAHLLLFIIFYVLTLKSYFKKGQTFSFGLIFIGLVKVSLFWLEERTIMKNPSLTLLSRFSIIILGFCLFYLFSDKKITFKPSRIRFNLKDLELIKLPFKKAEKNESTKPNRH